MSVSVINVVGLSFFFFASLRFYNFSTSNLIIIRQPSMLFIYYVREKYYINYNKRNIKFENNSIW